MKRRGTNEALRVALLAVVLALGLGAARSGADDVPATGGAREPLHSDTVERALVRLILLDVVVVDRDGRAVPGLTADDFELVIDHAEVRPPDTFDVDCDTIEQEDAPRRIVLAFDYQHLPMEWREDAIDRSKRLLERGGTGHDEIMVVALNGGLRVEQPFTSDPAEALHSLKRMQYDVSLWNGNFSHLSEDGFVGALTSLFEVLGTLPGPKAVVLYSAMRDVPLDLEFARLAAIAANSRCSLYPVDARGLTLPPPPGAAASPG